MTYFQLFIFFFYLIIYFSNTGCLINVYLSLVTGLHFFHLLFRGFHLFLTLSFMFFLLQIHHQPYFLSSHLFASLFFFSFLSALNFHQFHSFLLTSFILLPSVSLYLSPASIFYPPFSYIYFSTLNSPLFALCFHLVSFSLSFYIYIYIYSFSSTGNAFSAYSDVGNVPGTADKGDRARGEIIADITTTFMVLLAIYFPSVTGTSLLILFLTVTC